MALSGIGSAMALAVVALTMKAPDSLRTVATAVVEAEPIAMDTQKERSIVIEAPTAVLEVAKSPSTDRPKMAKLAIPEPPVAVISAAPAIEPTPPAVEAALPEVSSAPVKILPAPILELPSINPSTLMVEMVPAPVPKPAAPAAFAVQQPDIACTLLNIHYSINASKPRMLDQSALKLAGRWLASHSKAEVVIRSYTDAQGSATKNLALSHSRAVWVREALAAHGARRKRIRIQAFGEYALHTDIAPNDSANRRVTVEATGVECPPLFQENIQ